MENDEVLSKEAVKYVRAHKAELIERFAGTNFTSVFAPVSIYMAGSPGAGKTEFSKQLVRIFEYDGNMVEKIARIDPDEIRGYLPGYCGSNSSVFQHATSIGAHIIHDYVLEFGKNYVLDGTFSNYKNARSNILRSLEKKRTTEIYYLYQDPVLAWEITQKREHIENRCITKEVFIEKLFGAYDTVRLIKEEFNKSVILNVFTRDARQEIYGIRLNVENIDKVMKINYSKQLLMENL